MRIIHLLVIGALIFAAAYVYQIKMDSTARTEKVLRLHAEIREQRDAIASLRSDWAKLDAPLRLQGLAERHLPLKPINATQYDPLKNLPERPPRLFRPGEHFFSADVLPAGDSFDPKRHGHWSAQRGSEPLVTLFLKV